MPGLLAEKVKYQDYKEFKELYGDFEELLYAE